MHSRNYLRELLLGSSSCLIGLARREKPRLFASSGWLSLTAGCALAIACTSRVTRLLLAVLVDLLCLLLCQVSLVLHQPPPLHDPVALVVETVDIWVS